MKVCYWCRALSQSSDPKDLYWSFEDNNWDDNHFTTDEFFNERVPASGICPLIGIRHFHPSTIRWCMMHIVHLGLLYVCNGSGLNLLLRCGYFGSEAGIPVSIKLARAYQQFKQWTSANKIDCSQPPFTEKMLFKKNADILFTAKAYNSRVILEWLSREVYTASTADGASSFDPRFPLIAAALMRMSRFLGQCEQAGRYLTPVESGAIFHDGYEFLKIYKRLTGMSLRLGIQEWFLRPKCHALWHLLVCVRDRRSNPRFFHGFVDEDGMAYLKRVYLRAHPKTAVSWIMRCGKLRIWGAHLKIKRFNRHVAQRLARKRG